MKKIIKINHKKNLTGIYNTLYRAFGPQHWWPGDTPFEIAVGAILTQNTNWGNVEKAINNIKKHKALHAKKLHEMPHKDLALLIKPAGYFNVKAKRLKHFLAFLANHYNGSIEQMKSEDAHQLRHQLLEVNGIGPETADSILLYALDKPVFVVDAYTKRVLSRHEIISEKATYHEIQDLFHNNLPQDIKLFNEYHALFVMVGKDYCKPKPKCEKCPLKKDFIKQYV
ncbi:MAG: endonuclease III domain-containing protein [Nitrospirae bacterium]|nr:endonuclease III domain-containing protein [Nitrospirota bacterium]MBI4838994.1 endonuclease III domain-containing protein [Nitrospirota bacterium]